MSNKTWLLNAVAIKSARSCIKIVEEELGIRLTLSHPDFIALLGEYSELTDSPELVDAVKELMSFAGEDDMVPKTPTGMNKSKVIPISSDPSYNKNNNMGVNRRTEHPERRDEFVSYNGKDYSRWHDGKEFKGLYRGQPRYA